LVIGLDMPEENLSQFLADYKGFLDNNEPDTDCVKPIETLTMEI
jgi:hypothetical protein